MSQYRELQPAPSALTAPEAYEVLRAAVTQDGRFHFASEPPVLSPEAWGSLLGHFAVRLAELYAADPRTTDALTAEDAMQRILREMLGTAGLGRGTLVR